MAGLACSALVKRLLIAGLVLLSHCGGATDPRLTIQLPDGAIIIDASARISGHEAFFIGGDDEATIFSSAPQSDGSTSVVAKTIHGNLETEPHRTVTEGMRAARFWSACRADTGFAITWTDSPVELPIGITLNQSDTKAALSWPSSSESVVVHPNSIGSQRQSSVACVADDQRVVAWKHYCDGVENFGNGSFYFVPEECSEEPANGTYLRFFHADGEPYSQPILLTEDFYSPPLVAEAGESRFVVLFGSRIQSWEDEALVDEIDEPAVSSTYAEVTCVDRRCAAVTGGTLVRFDASDLSARRTIEFEPTVTPASNERYYADHPRVACDPRGTCVVTWVLRHEVWISDYVDTTTLGVYGQAFDLRTGVQGQRISLRESVPDERGTLVAATGDRSFLLASVLDQDFVVRKLLVD